ncbi:hypothetical protein GGI02_002588 [Coemansia sp. RSA 2322]|nr:hypothetical protein GGI02_002588 [Coemansia sp. RSA 2322]
MVAAPLPRNRYMPFVRSPLAMDTTYNSKLGYSSVVNTFEVLKPLPRRHQQRTTAVSPDGSKMCVVGDSNLVFLFHKRGDTFEKIATLTASNDASFSCDWSQSSELFAVGSQDGYVTVWDIRSHQQRLVQLETFQHGRSRGACRNVKFSPTGSIDLLAFSEHTSYVNIVDTRCFDKRQILHVSGMPEAEVVETQAATDSPSMMDMDLQITGLRFASDSSSLFVGLEESILEYAVDRVGRHSFSSSAII